MPSRHLVVLWLAASSPVLAHAATWKVVRNGPACSVVASVGNETIRYVFAGSSAPGELYIDGGPSLHVWKTDDGKVHRFSVAGDGHAQIYADETMPNDVSWVDGHKLPMGKDFDGAMTDCSGR